MATFWRCDVCKKEVTDHAEVKVIELPRMSFHKNAFTDEDDSVRKEICASCSGAVYTALEEEEKRAKRNA